MPRAQLSPFSFCGFHFCFARSRPPYPVYRIYRGFHHDAILLACIRSFSWLFFKVFSIEPALSQPARGSPGSPGLPLYQRSALGIPQTENIEEVLLDKIALDAEIVPVSIVTTAKTR